MRGARGSGELVSDRHFGPMEVLPTFYTFACFLSLRLQARRSCLRLQNRAERRQKRKDWVLKKEEMQTESVANRREGITERGSSLGRLILKCTARSMFILDTEM